ncbi:MAG: hypothetical protein JO317_01565 [Verrucomicrobiae bacterium]|nr:hypothetical protein [Verrucomicrobiae bacterium]
MSLKAFHLFFIALSTLLALGFAGWCAVQFANEHRLAWIFAAVGSLAAAAGLIWYGRRVYEKLKRLTWI